MALPQGKWLKNHKNGQGKMMWSQTGEVFTGEWLNGYPNGLGEHIWFGASLVPLLEAFSSSDLSFGDLGCAFCGTIAWAPTH